MYFLVIFMLFSINIPFLFYIKKKCKIVGEEYGFSPKEYYDPSFLLDDKTDLLAATNVDFGLARARFRRIFWTYIAIFMAVSMPLIIYQFMRDAFFLD